MRARVVAGTVAALSLLGAVAALRWVRPPSPPPEAREPSSESPSESPSASLDAAASMPLERVPGAQRALTPAFVATGTDGGTSPVRAVFDWSPPCRVPTVQDTVRDGKKGRIRMDVVLERRGDALVLEMRDVQISQIEGTDVTADSPVDPVLKGLTASLPAGIIARDGTFRGASDLVAFGERMAATFAASGDPSLERIAPMMRLPVTRGVMEGDLRATWSSWVERWVIESFPAVERHETRARLVAGRKIPIVSYAANLGPVDGAPDLVLLTARDVIDGAPAEAAFEAATALALRQADAATLGADAAAEMYGGMRSETVLVAAIDPRTARPHRARSEVRVKTAAGESIAVRDTMFDWSAAVGCGADAAPRR